MRFSLCISDKHSCQAFLGTSCVPFTDWASLNSCQIGLPPKAALTRSDLLNRPPMLQIIPSRNHLVIVHMICATHGDGKTAERTTLPRISFSHLASHFTPMVHNMKCWTRRVRVALSGDHRWGSKCERGGDPRIQRIVRCDAVGNHGVRCVMTHGSVVPAKCPVVKSATASANSIAAVLLQ